MRLNFKDVRWFGFAAVLFALWGCTGAMRQRVAESPLQGNDQSLYGLVEPLWERQSVGGNLSEEFQVRGFDLDKTIDLAAALGATSFRLMFHVGTFNDLNEVDTALVNYYQRAIQKMHSVGIHHIIGMCMVFPEGSGFVPDSPYSAPHLDDENYGRWLSGVETTWAWIASTFPGISFWEMGNEFNMDIFYHPNGFKGKFGSEGMGGFDRLELIQQNVNYLYHASRGIKSGNPNAQAVMPGYSPGFNGLASKELENFIRDLYMQIASGEYPFGATKSTDPDDYFDILAWHPYVIEGVVDSTWVYENKAIYEVAKQFEDRDKAVYFTEFGFTDYGVDSLEQVQIQYMRAAFDFIGNELPFVKNVSAFRLFECEYATTWGGKGEVHFGYFQEPTGEKGFVPKAKAYALQAIYGGKGNLTQYE